MFSNLKHISRLFFIARVLAKNNALFFIKNRKIAIIKAFVIFKKRNGNKGERLAAAFQELGPIFIKFGQFLAVRPDIVGAEIADGLTQLQDKLPPFDSEIAIKTIEKQLGKNLADLFDEFDETPVAAASISQVHFAKTKEGRDVAVKILRPQIEKDFKRDIEFFYWIAEIITRKFASAKRLKLEQVVDSFAATVKLEMDLRFEAAAASELKENMKNDAGFFIPEVDWQLTSNRVLTIGRVHGIKIDDVQRIKKAGHDINNISKKLAEMFFLQALRDGFFHADIHPGNLFVDGAGNIAIVDFGIMGRIDKNTRIFFAEIILGFLNRDYKKVADVHFEAGYVPAHQDRDIFAAACRSIGEPIFGRPQNEISLALLLSQLFKITEDFEMETQPQLLLLQKTMMLAEGLGRKLTPDINFWELIRPLAEKWGEKNMGLKSQVKNAIMENIKNLRNVINNLSELSDITKKIVTQDGVKLHPETIERIRAKNNSTKNIWKIIFLSAIVSAVTVILLTKYLI